MAWVEAEGLGRCELAPADLTFVDMIRRSDIELWAGDGSIVNPEHVEILKQGQLTFWTSG